MAHFASSFVLDIGILAGARFKDARLAPDWSDPPARSWIPIPWKLVPTWMGEGLSTFHFLAMRTWKRANYICMFRQPRMKLIFLNEKGKPRYCTMHCTGSLTKPDPLQDQTETECTLPYMQSWTRTQCNIVHQSSGSYQHYNIELLH